MSNHKFRENLTEAVADAKDEILCRLVRQSPVGPLPAGILPPPPFLPCCATPPWPPVPPPRRLGAAPRSTYHHKMGTQATLSGLKSGCRTASGAAAVTAVASFPHVTRRLATAIPEILGR